MKIVIALGGNAIARHGDRMSAEAQREAVAASVSALADIARGHDVVVTHGNAPQVGLLALQALAHGSADAYPLDVLGAETEGQIGYLIESEFSRVFPNSATATLLTQVEVHAQDPAFGKPTKAIGPHVDGKAARELTERLGWSFGVEIDAAGSERFRRLVPSPEPQHVRELAAIELLVDAGVLVVCAGGGGIPVVRSRDGALLGVEAVLDKDLTAALLAREIDADWLLLLTDVEGVYRNWPARDDLIREASVSELRSLPLEAGTMGPKVEAACRFAEQGGNAAIGNLEAARFVMTGAQGTRVLPDA